MGSVCIEQQQITRVTRHSWVTGTVSSSTFHIDVRDKQREGLEVTHVVVITIPSVSIPSVFPCGVVAISNAVIPHEFKGKILQFNIGIFYSSYCYGVRR